MAAAFRYNRGMMKNERTVLAESRCQGQPRLVAYLNRFSGL